MVIGNAVGQKKYQLLVGEVGFEDVVTWQLSRLSSFYVYNLDYIFRN